MNELSFVFIDILQPRLHFFLSAQKVGVGSSNGSSNSIEGQTVGLGRELEGEQNVKQCHLITRHTQGRGK